MKNPVKARKVEEQASTHTKPTLAPTIFNFIRIFIDLHATVRFHKTCHKSSAKLIGVGWRAEQNREGLFVNDLACIKWF